MEKESKQIQEVLNFIFELDSHKSIKIENGRINFRCPICKGSAKNEIDYRAKVFPLNGEFKYICWNCNYRCSYNTFITLFKPQLRENKLKYFL